MGHTVNELYSMAHTVWLEILNQMRIPTIIAVAMPAKTKAYFGFLDYFQSSSRLWPSEKP